MVSKLEGNKEISTHPTLSLNLTVLAMTTASISIVRRYAMQEWMVMGGPVRFRLGHKLAFDRTQAIH